MLAYGTTLTLHPETVGYLTKTLFEQREQFVRDIEEAVRELKKI